MTNNILKYLEGLEELEKKATPAPWSVYGATGEGMYIAQYKALSNGYFELIDYAYAYDRKRRENALFIINQRNEFPKLLSAMREMASRLRIIHEEVSEGYNVKTEASMVLEKVEQILCKEENK